MADVGNTHADRQTDRHTHTHTHTYLCPGGQSQTPQLCLDVSASRAGEEEVCLRSRVCVPLRSGSVWMRPVGGAAVGCQPEGSNKSRENGGVSLTHTAATVSATAPVGLELAGWLDAAGPSHAPVTHAPTTTTTPNCACRLVGWPAAAAPVLQQQTAPMVG